ncbi:uncharacterized protein KY384_008087 [Bacidia gigantensis]|uniref:uncharacterized protein n=1 Tax=Bacidia gigantensis TaxID=2732470 RepID=UPI001D0379F3|nr:uncharacterized protein KY384_008087 [Bacidia gigantensis]KAG8526658.1 hypothetical protein KY384_008087 [Bacidia gigantensis]
MSQVSTYNTLALSSGINVSYIEAGSPHNPTLLLLHGLPSSSNQFRNLIPLLAASYHILAPDLPSYGLTTVPADFVYTFENLTKVTGSFLEALKITSYAVYIFDYGAPVGFRLATASPTSSPVKAIISQNGNAYDSGFGHPFWTPVEALWNSSNALPEREYLRNNFFTLESCRYQYEVGVPASDLKLINPAAWTYDFEQNIQGKENQDRQLDILYDYRTNKALYPAWQKYLRESQVPLLAIWGKNDPCFIYPGAEAFKKDLPHAKVELLDAGHFALETKVGVIAEEALKFLKGVKF